MEILIISKSRGAAGQFRIGRLTLALLLLTIVVGVAGASYYGHVRGGAAMAELIMNNPERSTQIWQREIVSQRKYLSKLDRDMDADLAALAGAVGRFDSQLRRLDAMAARVAVASKLNPSEFNFEQDPPVGGMRDSFARPPQWDDLFENLAAVKNEIALRDARLTMLDALLGKRQLQDDTEPTGRPVREGWISSGYGYRTDPVTGEREFHSGLDFAAHSGSQVRAVAAGLVTWSGQRWGYGNMVEISHGNGYLTRYAHNRANLVKLGEKVEKSQAIALLGSTGRATGPHVHFEVIRNDDTVNPRQFVDENKTKG